jgi:hypothetical protein
MEYIEAASGVYPSTEGFLRLLRAMVVMGGCPSTLGDSWRVRAGCSPYIEYVLHLVLPRSMGTFSGLPPLPFRSLEDKNRLLSAAFEVIDACITRYVVPMSLASATDKDIQRSFTREKVTAEKVLGLASLVDGVVVPTTMADSKSFIYDFRPMDSSLLPKPLQPPGGSVPQRVLASPLPLPKSPGFLVLAEALMSTSGSFFEVLAAVLGNSVSSSDGADADRFALCYALFGATPPTVASTKARNKSSLSDILVSLQTSNRPCFETATKLRHKITYLVLNILCAAASREENFQLALTSSNGPTSIIPVLRFQAKCSTPRAIDLQLSRVGQLLSVRHLVPALVDCIGYDGTEDIDFSASSVALYFYVQKLEKQNLRADLVSAAFARRLWSLSEQCLDDPRQAQLLRTILDRVLADLRSGQFSPLLGSTNSPAAGFDAIIGILKSANFVASPTTSAMAASCYEIAYLIEVYPMFSAFLSSLEFWAIQLSTVVQLISQHYDMLGTNLLDGNVALSVAWILKGLAGELRPLLSSPVVAHILPATRPIKYKRTLSLLFDENCFVRLVHRIPVDQPVYSAALSDALHVVLGGALLSCAALGDTIETSQIITALVDQLSLKVHPETARSLALCIYLATIHTPMAGEGIGRLAVVLANSLGIGGIASGILSSALEISLHRWLPTEGGIPDQAPFLRAATVLIRRSCQVSDGFPMIADSDAIMARSCLKVLLMTVLDDNTAHRLLTDPGDFRHASPPINTFVKHLSKLDSNVPFLLHAIAVHRFGTDLLFEADVFGALTAAAVGYTRHESQIEYSTFQSPTMTIAPPPFWSGHLKLMSLMIAGASGDRKLEIAGRAINVLSRYEVSSTNLLNRFPSDGEEALAFCRCCALAHGAVDRERSSMTSPSVPVTGYRTISVLTMHIAENLLPEALQTPLPAHLMSTKNSVDSDVVAVCHEDSTWWDKLDLSGTGAPKMRQVFLYGIAYVLSGRCFLPRTSMVSAFSHIYFYPVYSAVGASSSRPDSV